MIKLLPWKSEYCTVYSFLVTLNNPDKTDINTGYLFIVSSYIDDPEIISAIIKKYTKYEFTIKFRPECLKSDKSHRLNEMSLNETIGFLRRFRFIKKTTVIKQKVIEYRETIEEEL